MGKTAVKKKVIQSQNPFVTPEKVRDRKKLAGEGESIRFEIANSIHSSNSSVAQKIENNVAMEDKENVE